MSEYDDSSLSSGDEEELDSLMLQMYTNKIPSDKHEEEPHTEEESVEESSRSAILKGLSEDNGTNDSSLLEKDKDTVIVNLESDSDEEKEKQRPSLTRRYYEEEDLSLICYNCGKSGHSKFDCVEATKEIKCRECGEYGHPQYKCPNKLCFKCLRRGHMSRDCPNAHLRLCHRCGEYGHNSRDCRALVDTSKAKRTPVLYLVGRGSGRPYCYNCGLNTHTAEDCGEPTISDLLRYNQQNRRSSYEPAPKKRRKR